MMTLSHRFPDFGRDAPGDEQTKVDEDGPLQNHLREAYDAGYSAGQADAVQAQADDRMSLSAELAQNLQDMAFTYRDAVADVVLNLRPLMQQIVGKLLPAVARHGLGGQILEQVGPLIQCHADAGVIIRVAPESHDIVAALITPALPDVLSLTTDATLASGQARIQVGPAERDINLDALITDVSNAMTAYFHHVEQEHSNG
ncbi:hypothetical protein [Sulfitobacter sabulilitoris]|uniref:Flagellar biosynthesis protein n=1 Tax=Sulfitobacter sabulilitoris TaxID=2562655 RepID=A0A5S3PEK9_9RHOB|nr:hypothetical protein [Sulfitobacter sabulilitoris]TMM52492.1 hypothetical protein FDT80_09435 [Sulfitobacter sabulilitoris]